MQGRALQPERGRQFEKEQKKETHGPAVVADVNSEDRPMKSRCGPGRI
jgi:hypothetical protein